MHLNSFLIRTRLWIGFGTLLLIILAMLAFNTHRLSSIAKQSTELLAQDVSALEDAMEVAKLMQENGRRVSALFLTRDQNVRKEHYQAIDQNKKSIIQLLERLAKQENNSNRKSLIDTARISNESFVSTFVKAADSLELDDIDAAENQMNGAVFPALKKANDAMKAIVDYQRKKMQTEEAAINSDVSFSIKLMILVGILFNR